MAMKTLGTLLNDSIAFTKKHLTALVIGAVVFGVVTNGATWFLMGATAPGAIQNMGAWQTQMETLGNRMEALQKKATSGMLDAAGEKEMQDLAEKMMRETSQGANMIKGTLFALIPGLGMSFLVALLIGLFAKSYFLMVAVKGFSDAGSAAKATLGSIVPLIGLWIWLLLRSFIWIPFLGFIIAIIVGPRLFLSPLYLLEQGKGITESARLSYKATQGQWGKIVGNALLVGIVTMVCASIVSRIAIFILGMMLGGFVAAVIGQFAAAFMTVFGIQLARTVMAK